MFRWIHLSVFDCLALDCVKDLHGILNVCTVWPKKEVIKYLERPGSYSRCKKRISNNPILNVFSRLWLSC